MTELFCLVGPTATGKTEVAARVLEPLAGTIISADARQVYRFLDIGTNKPSPELQARVQVAMLDLKAPEQAYTAADFARDARAVVANLRSAGRPFMLVGGSGLYLKALFQPFFAVREDSSAARNDLSQLATPTLYQELTAIDPETAGRLHANDRQRIIRALEVYSSTGRTLTQLRAEPQPAPEFSPVYVGLELPRPELRTRIDQRFDRMLSQGFLDEVQNLMRMGYDEKTPALDAIGYRELLAHLHGRLTLDQAVDEAKKRSRAYAKRQMTWFRRQPGVAWVDAQDPAAAARDVAQRFQDYLAQARVRTGSY
jgi:tRNA dimethylallyltransferase